MPIVFDAADRKAISRRMINIPIENAAFAQAETNTVNAVNQYMAVDHGNKDYYDFFAGIVSSYETEQRWKTGITPGTFVEADIIDAAGQVAGNLFFPTVAPFNSFLIPLIISQVNGGSSSNTPPGEKPTISSPLVAAPSGDGIIELASVLRNGFNFGVGVDALSAPYNPGDTTVNLGNNIGAAAGQYIYIQGSGHSLIAVVTAVGGGGLTLTVYPITTPGGAIAALGSVVSQSFAGFNQAQRQSLVATIATQQDVLDGLTTAVSSGLIQKVTNWATCLTNENTALNTNEENRAIQIAQNTAEIAAILVPQAAIVTWQGLANAAVGGKFDNAPLTALTNAATARLAVINNRLTQIGTALGAVIDNSDGTFTFTGSNTEMYYQRYELLNTRINRAFGSLTRAVKLQNSVGSFQGMVANNNFLFGLYTLHMVATSFNDATGNNRILVTSTNGFSPGDSAYVISETQIEIPVTIRDIAQNVMTLNTDIPITYLKSDIARIYKVF